MEAVSEEKKLGPNSLKKLTRNLITEAGSRKERKEKVEDIKTQIHKVKRFAAHPTIKKETVKKEVNVLLEKLDEILHHEVSLGFTQDELLKQQIKDTQLVQDLKDRIIDLERELMKSESQHRRDLNLQIMKLNQLSNALKKTETEIEKVEVKTEETIKEERKEQEELIKIEQQLKKLEDIHSKLSKQKGHDKEHLKKLKNRIDSTKNKIKQVKKD